jgi:hypothetical protein
LAISGSAALNGAEKKEFERVRPSAGIAAACVMADL